MTSLPALESLLARVRAAKGPDRELDARLYCMKYESAYPDETEEQHLEYARKSAPQYSASIDAALALVEKVLPEHKNEWVVGMKAGGEHVAFIGDHQANGCANSPLTLIAALLQAVIQRETQNAV